MNRWDELLRKVDDLRHDLPTIPAPARFVRLPSDAASAGGPRAALGLGALLAGLSAGAFFFWPAPPPASPVLATVTATEPMGPPAPPPPAPVEDLHGPVAIGRGGTLDKAIRKLGLSEIETGRFLASLTGVISPRQLRPEHAVSVALDGSGRFLRGELVLAPFEIVDVRPNESGALVAAMREHRFETRVEALSVTIEGSLYESLEKAGEDAGLAVAASEVLAWQLDFYRDVRAGDRLEVVLERVTHEGQRVRNGELLAVRWTGAAGTHEFFRHTAQAGTTHWYASDGSSARRAFLKQPLPLVRITSGFGKRRHPTLGYMKKHEGVDYGAPTGTPVWAVADGTVTWAGRKGPNGNLVSIRHANGFESHMAHLSKVLVKVGQRVQQKQVVGKVGSTGRSTGPHLHFALSNGGRMVNPLSQKFPSADPLPAGDVDAFARTVASMQPLLDGAAPDALVATAP